MSDPKFKAPRMVVARRSLLLGAAGTAFATPLLATGEGGEGGEGAATHGLPPRVEMLTMVGFYDAAIRIVAELYTLGETREARDQLLGSHHAHYDDIAAGLENFDAPDFEAEAQAFAQAVEDGADATVVATRHAALRHALSQVYDGASAAELIQMAEALVRAAYGDYEAGVYEGEVISAHEYRDAWGFAKVAEERVQGLAASDDAQVAEVGARGLSAMADVWSLFPSLTASTVDGADSSILAGAAARLEIAGLRLT